MADEDDEIPQEETPEPRLFTLTEAERTRRELEPILIEVQQSQLRQRTYERGAGEAVSFEPKCGQIGELIQGRIGNQIRVCANVKRNKICQARQRAKVAEVKQRVEAEVTAMKNKVKAYGQSKVDELKEGYFVKVTTSGDEENTAIKIVAKTKE